jgi:hypothetical protein
MVSAEVSFDLRPENERVTEYALFVDDVESARNAVSPILFGEIPQGSHKYEIAALGPWGFGPKSDPVVVDIPPTGQVINVKVSIAVTVQTS